MKNITIILIVMFLAMFAGAKGVSSSSPIYKGIASWYSQEDPGILETTANMERFDDTQLTCAMWDVPFDTIVKVTNLENGRYILVRVNDRGPAKRLRRIIDLTKGAFSKIGDLNKGLINVLVEII
jgi:rare lipoprotein A